MIWELFCAGLRAGVFVWGLALTLIAGILAVLAFLRVLFPVKIDEEDEDDEQVD